MNMQEQAGVEKLVHRKTYEKTGGYAAVTPCNTSMRDLARGR